jgi:antitoxin component YwqK of YwqJK toxin-antitoxin module
LRIIGKILKKVYSTGMKKTNAILDIKANKTHYFTKSFLLLLISLAISCNKEPEPWKEKCIIYKDSLYKTPLDTILLFEKDSNFVKKDGYYRIYSSNIIDNYATGKIKNHKKVGSWKSYYNNALDAEENYNDKGELNGFVIQYDSSNGNFFSVYHFVNGEQEGIQKEYHPNNILARSYTLHRSYDYRGEYVCYDKRGGIIYKENFGKEGTGYYKEFRDDTIFREGAILKDRYVGMYIEKNYYLSGGSTTKQIFRSSKGGMYMVKIFGNLNEVYETKGDSMVYYYLKNKTKRTTFLKGKIIKNEQFNDTLLSL